MATIKFNINNKLIDAATTPNGHLILLEHILSKLSESLQDHIKIEIERSAQLSAFVGNMADPEAMKAIIRSIKVILHKEQPTSLTAIYKDELGHWYQESEMPKEVQKSINDLMDNGISNWLRSNKPKEIMREIINSAV